MRNLLVGIILILSVPSVDGQDLMIFNGTPSFNFYLGSTHLATDSSKIELEKGLKYFEKKSAVLKEYFSKLSSGDLKEAKRILRKEKDLRKHGDFTIGMMFTLTRMKELEILYKPCFQIKDEIANEAVISCSVDEFNSLKRTNGEIRVECKYLGPLYVDNKIAYELVAYKTTANKVHNPWLVCLSF